MKKTIISLVALSTLGMASSVMAATGDDMGTGQASFQWAGTVPAITAPASGYFIVPEGSIGFNDGLLTFTNTAEGVKLNGSTEIGFKVVKDATVEAGKGYDAATDVQPMPYKGTLTSVKVGINSMAAEQAADGYFNVLADGTALTVNDADAISKTAPNNVTRLTVQAKDAAANTALEAGDSVVLQALVAVTPQEI